MTLTSLNSGGVPVISERDRLAGRVVPNRICSRSRRGFTLLETILAVGLSALLVGLLAAGMRIYTQVVADRRADVVNARVARGVFKRIADDIEASYYGSITEDQGDAMESTGDTSDTGDDLSADTSDTETTDVTADLTSSTVQATPGLYGNQFELQMDVMGRFPDPVRYDIRLSTGVDPMSANMLSNPKTVTYYVRAALGSELAGTPLQTTQATILVRRIQNRAQAAFDTNSVGAGDVQLGEQLLSDQVSAIEFAYHDGYDWLDSWDSSTDGGLPVAVRITVTVVDEAADPSEVDQSNPGTLFQRIVRLPTAELPPADTSTTGI